MHAERNARSFQPFDVPDNSSHEGLASKWTC
jgi:hypothetical protein